MCMSISCVGDLRTTKALTLLLTVCGKMELNVQDGCVLWGARVVIPQQGRQQVMSELNAAHPGINRMKGLARSYVWWPGMDCDLENPVHKCTTCQEHRHVSVCCAATSMESFQMVRGSELMWTMLAPSKVKCFWWSSMPFQMVRSCHRDADDLNSDHLEDE